MINKSQMSKGFTLVEMLVVIAILAIVGTLILNIFTRTLQGNNKAQIIGIIKQNGQTILETMDKTIRNADHLICTGTSSDPNIGNATLVVIKDGVYTRFRFIEPQPSDNPTVNGFIDWESFNLPESPPPGTDPNLYVRDFDKIACNLPSTDATKLIKLTDTNTQTGVSVVSLIFEKTPKAGFKNIVNVLFTLKAGVQAPAAIAGQIDPVDFQTTIQLR